MSGSENRPVHVFISYRHANRGVLEELRNHLGWLQNSKEITVFDDSQITAGDDWDVIIQQELDRADIIILVVTGAFMGSAYCTRKELLEALRLRSSRGVRVLPIIAEACDWEAMPLQSIAALPKDSDNNLKPLNKWGRNRDVALTQVAQQVRQNIERVRARTPSDHPRHSQPGKPSPDSPASSKSLEASGRPAVGEIPPSQPDEQTSETQADALAPLHQLPTDVADFAGRAAQVEALLGVLSAPGGRVAISAIDGMGGLGKTTLAVHVAHRLTGRYPDGQIVVDMAGTSAAPLTPAQGLARVIRAFAPLMQVPEAVTELRPIYLSLLHGRRVLIILDNAVNGDQVAPLVPPENCALIVTARRRIAVAGVVRVDLDLLAPAEATGLLRAIIGGGRAGQAERARIAELCGFLPLALRVAGMFLVESPHWTAAEFIAALADQRQRLGLLQLEGSAALDVAASLALSVAELRHTRPDIADRWHELAVFPAGFDTGAAAAVWQQPAAEARDALGVLLSRSMVLYDPAQQRWRLHDLMRDLAGGGVVAAEALGAPAGLADRLAAARRRHAEHYKDVLAATD
jgi:hypothetical protein